MEGATFQEISLDVVTETVPMPGTMMRSSAASMNPIKRLVMFTTQSGE
jgi:hypothetical protein